MPTTFLKNPLLVSGTPAAATSGEGAQPPNTMTVEGTTGQETTGTGETAGAGADVSIAAGSGGAAPSGSTNGVGGSVTVNPGPPGLGAGTVSAHGNVLLATLGGKVGIGTINPKAVFHSVGQLRSEVEDDTTAFRIVDPSQANAISFYRDSNKALTIDVGATSRAFVIKNTGNVGINGNLGIKTTNPQAVLHVVGQMRLEVPDDITAFRIVDPAQSNSISVYRDTNKSLTIDVGAASRAFVIKNNGNIGVGTTSPGSKLHVNGGVQVGTPTGGDQGSGSINIAGDFYKNGTPVLARLEKTISDLTKRLGRLEKALSKKPGKATVVRKSAKPKKSTKSRKSAKGRR
jgi:hypothetical protein